MNTELRNELRAVRNVSFSQIAFAIIGLLTYFYAPIPDAHFLGMCLSILGITGLLYLQFVIRRHVDAYISSVLFAMIASAVITWAMIASAVITWFESERTK